MLIFIAVGAAATAWLTPRPEIDEDDAAEVALGALDEASVDATLAKAVVESEYVPDNDDPLEVWVVTVSVGEEMVELQVDQQSGQLVYVDDNIGPNDSERLLTDEQFEVVAKYRSTELRDWIRRNAFGSAAATLIAILGFIVSKRSDRLWKERQT